MGKIPKIYVGDQMVTRSKKRVLDAFGIDGCYVRLETSLQTEVINWLEKTDPKNSESAINRDDPNSRRRGSVVGASLVSVNNRVQEHSSDYLEKIPRPFAMPIETETKSASTIENAPKPIVYPSNVISSNVGSSDQPENNQSICCGSGNIHVDGKKKNMVLNNFDPFQRLPNVPFATRGRARTQSVDCMPARRPSLSTILEHRFEYELAAAEALVYDGGSSPEIVSPTEDVSDILSQLNIDGDNRPISNDADLIFGTQAEGRMSTLQNAAIISKWVARAENFEL